MRFVIPPLDGLLKPLKSGTTSRIYKKANLYIEVK